MQKKLIDVCNIQYGYAFNASLFSEKVVGLPVVRIRDIVRGYSQTFTTEEYFTEYIVNNNDVLIGMDGEFNIAYWHGGKALLNQRVCKLIPKAGTNIEYLYFYLQTVLKRIEAGTSFATVKHLSVRKLNAIKIPLISLEKQKQIAMILRNIDNLVECQKILLSKLDELVKAKFVEMFGDCTLTQCKNDWKKIADIGEVIGGSTPKTDIEEYWNGNLRWISPAEIVTENIYLYDSEKKITIKGKESCSLRELPEGTVILSSRAPIGKLAIAANTFYCNQGFKNIVCKSEVLPRYLYTLLLMNVDYLISLGRGATFKEISKTIVESIKIPVPDIKQQEKFVEFATQIDQVAINQKNVVTKLETLKQSLMQEYFG